jgi:hypothetical protein
LFTIIINGFVVLADLEAGIDEQFWIRVEFSSSVGLVGISSIGLIRHNVKIAV